MKTFPMTLGRHEVMLGGATLAMAVYAVIVTAQLHEVRSRLRLADRLFIVSATSQATASPVSEISGIGITLGSDTATGMPQISQVLPNSPAAKAELSLGDIIRKIDDVETTGKTLSECASLIRGPEGTPVRLEIARSSARTTLQLELTRQTIRVTNGNTR